MNKALLLCPVIPEGNQFLRLNIGCPRSKVETGVNAIINAIKALE